MATDRTIVLADEFSDSPAGRFKSDGPYSGEHFREDYLIPAIRENDRVEVVLDKTDGYGSSFLEEAFGGLYRSAALRGIDIATKLVLVAQSNAYQRYKRLAEKYMSEARSRAAHGG